VETVLVLAERHGTACALLTLARRLGAPIAVKCGTASVDTLARYGARAIWAVESPEADVHPATARVEALTKLAATTRPCCVLIAEGHDGPEIAGRVAVRLDSGVLTGAVDLWMGPRGPIVTQRVLGGSHLVESEVIRGVTVCTVRTCEVEATQAPARPHMNRLDLVLSQGTRAARLVSRAPSPHDLSNVLSAAAIVVAGGRGLGSREGFRLADRLAHALGGAACGSHTATELGWCPPHRRVDQIGKAVHPLLYLALGISGSVRHRAGMQGAHNIVAVDRDPQAPIFGVADLGVVGDARDVASELLIEIQRRREETET